MPKARASADEIKVSFMTCLLFADQWPTLRLACTFTLCCTSEDMPEFWLETMIPAPLVKLLAMLLDMLKLPASSAIAPPHRRPRLHRRLHHCRLPQHPGHRCHPDRCHLGHLDRLGRRLHRLHLHRPRRCHWWPECWRCRCWRCHSWPCRHPRLHRRCWLQCHPHRHCLWCWSPCRPRRRCRPRHCRCRRCRRHLRRRCRSRLHSMRRRHPRRLPPLLWYRLRRCCRLRLHRLHWRLRHLLP